MKILTATAARAVVDTGRSVTLEVMDALGGLVVELQRLRGRLEGRLEAVALVAFELAHVAAALAVAVADFLAAVGELAVDDDVEAGGGAAFDFDAGVGGRGGVEGCEDVVELHGGGVGD